MIGRTNTAGGGLQDTDALLRVQAPAGSVVSITKSGMTKTDHGHENADDHSVYDYYFIIHQSQFDSVNPWTVTATLDAATVSNTVIIDSADEYDMILSYLVPPEYQAVEYLQSSGTQYIVTNYSLPSGWFSGPTHYECKYRLISGTGKQGQWGQSGDNYYFGYHVGYKGSGTQEIGITNVLKTFSASYNTDILAEIDGNGTAITDKVNGSVVMTGTAGSNYLAGSPLPLFAEKKGSGSVSNQMTARIYSYKITKNDVPTIWLIPCYRKSDSVAGMWDKVSETFYTNNGSGTFTVGGDIN